MSQSHPPTLIRSTLRTLREESSVKPGDSVLVAVSGGRDSMALMHVLSLIRAELGIRVAAYGVDHGLRPAAAGELDRAEDFAARIEVPFARGQLELSKEGGNLQARAREGRYRLLERHAHEFGARFIATGHHADDRAETVLLRVLRGALVEGLGVLPVERSFEDSGGTELVRLRPLVRARRKDISAHVERHAVPFSEDPSNADPRYLRTRVRHELLPLLESLSPGIVGHLTALSDDVCRRLPRGLSGTPETALAGVGRAHLEALLGVLERPRAGVRIAIPDGFEIRVERTPLRTGRPRQRTNPGKRNGIDPSGGESSGKSG